MSISSGLPLPAYCSPPLQTSNPLLSPRSRLSSAFATIWMRFFNRDKVTWCCSQSLMFGLVQFFYYVSAGAITYFPFRRLKTWSSQTLLNCFSSFYPLLRDQLRCAGSGSGYHRDRNLFWWSWCRVWFCTWGKYAFFIWFPVRNERRCTG